MTMPRKAILMKKMAALWARIKQINFLDEEAKSKKLIEEVYETEERCQSLIFKCYFPFYFILDVINVLLIKVIELRSFNLFAQ